MNLDTVNKALDRLAELGPNWNSYGSNVIDPRAIARVRCILRNWNKRRPDIAQPDIVPLSDGGVSVSWSGEGEEFAVNADGEIDHVYADRDGDRVVLVAMMGVLKQHAGAERRAVKP